MDFHHSLSEIATSPPLVVAPVTDAPGLQALRDAETAAACDIIELRADAIGLPASELAATAKGTVRPLLLTVRRGDEGGHGDWEDAAREAYFLEMLGSVAAIDVEMRSFDALDRVVRSAREAGVMVVGSAHDFVGMPAGLSDLVESGASRGVDVVKIAATPAGLADVTRLAELAQSPPDGVRVAAMGMGPWGRLSRLVCATAGSVLNYGYLKTATVPGQWPAGQLRTLISDLRGG